MANSTVQGFKRMDDKLGKAAQAKVRFHQISSAPARSSCPSHHPSQMASLIAFTPSRSSFRACGAMGYQVVSKPRSDANLLYRADGAQKKRGRRRRFDGKVSFTDLRRFQKSDTAQPHLTLYTQVVWSVSLKRAIRVVVVVNTKEKEKPGYVVLFSTDTALCAADILRFYKARFAIEFIFRDAKGFAGFSDCQARDKEALHVHFNASVTLVNLARIRAHAEHQTAEKMVFSMASIKQRAFNEQWLKLIISKLALEQTAVINHPQFECLRNYAAIAA